MSVPPPVKVGSLAVLSLAVVVPVLAFAQAPAPQEQPAPQPPPAAPDGGAAPSESEAQMEADIFGKNAPAATPPAAAVPSPAPPQGPPPRPRLQMERPPQGNEAAAQADSHTAFVIELETGGFASGTLDGGLFLGARLSPDAGNLIVGGSVNFNSQSTTMPAATPTGTSTTTSQSSFSIGAGARYTLISANDGKVDLYGAGDLGIVHAGASASGTSSSGTGFTLAAGPGLRVWLYDHIAVGYLARLRLTQLSGSSGSGDSTTAGFFGTFQLLGVF